MRNLIKINRALAAKKTKLLTLFCCLMWAATMFAYDASVDGLYYNLNSTDYTATVTYRSYYINSSIYNQDWNIQTADIPSSITISGKNYTVTAIGSCAFINCKKLTSVTIPSSVTSIGNAAFSGCSSLTSVTIGNSVKSIGGSAFSGCSRMNTVTIPNSVTSIGSDAFNGCSYLTSITLSNSITSIAANTFYECNRLASINIPNSVTSIGKYAFFQCDSLTSITIPNSVKSIGEYAFAACDALTSVNIPEGVTRIEKWTFNGCYKLTSVTIPNSLTHIGDYAFDYCPRLTSITIPAGVGYIGDYAFRDCTGLTFVTCKAIEPPTCGGYAFSGVVSPASIPLYVPAGSEESYQSADWWKFFKPIVPFETGKKYTITFVNYDGTELQVLKNVEAGSIPSYTGAIPIRPSDNLYTYTFSGWSPSVAPATANVTYTAKFRPTLIQIPGQDINSTWLQTGGTDLGVMTTSNSNVWTYNSYYGAVAQTGDGNKGWLLTPAMNLNDMKSVTLSFSHVHKNAGTFNKDMTLWVCADYKGSVEASFWQQLTISPYASNTDWTYVDVSIDVPLDKVGPNTVFGFKYVSSNDYAKWEIKNVHLQALCNNSVPKTYTIRFLNYDGSELQVLTDVKEGTKPVYTGATPTRPADAQYTYTFKGWSPSIVAATADATYTAQFTATEIQTIICEDATWLQTGGTDLGEITTNNPDIWYYDSKYGACAEANIGDEGWLLTPAENLKGMKSVTLSFNHVHKKAGTFNQDMTLWVCANYKGSVEASSWQQLIISPYAANTDWTFVDVSVDVPLNLVGANTVFGFKYVSSNNSAKWEIKNLHLEAVCGSVAPKTYTIRFLNYDGSELQVLTDVEEGTIPQYTGATPTRPADAQYNYTFKGWSPTIVAATADATYTARYLAVPVEQEPEATEADNVEVTATPTQEGSVILEWPAVENADTYTITIAKNGEVICTLVFNAQGQLISIAFAAPARDGNERSVAAAEQAAKGWRYEVKGLAANTQYTYSVTAKQNDDVLSSTTITFTMPAPQGIDDVKSSTNVQKFVRNGKVYILRNGKTYTVTGQEVK